MGGGAVEITAEGKMDTVFAFKLENLKIRGHRLPSFLPPGGGIIRLPYQVSIDGRRDSPLFFSLLKVVFNVRCWF